MRKCCALLHVCFDVPAYFGPSKFFCMSGSMADPAKAKSGTAMSADAPPFVLAGRPVSYSPPYKVPPPELQSALGSQAVVRKAPPGQADQVPQAVPRKAPPGQADQVLGQAVPPKAVAKQAEANAPAVQAQWNAAPVGLPTPELQHALRVMRNLQALEASLDLAQFDSGLNLFYVCAWQSCQPNP